MYSMIYGETSFSTFRNDHPTPPPYSSEYMSSAIIEWKSYANKTLQYRAWVRGHAQDYILSYFSVLTTRRKDQHAQTIHRITERAAYYYHALPHPSEIAAADADLKRGIDEDWRASVQRYPEVLEYFYGLVDLNLPSDDEPGVRDPPLSALSGVGVGRERERKVRLREPSEIEERRRRRRSRGRDELERERVVAPPAAQALGSRTERVRPGPAYAPAPVPGYGYVPAGY